ncbi:unnamed protein product [Didymodactylos carnosus]|uniref:ABC transporter domain-containing protein n=1 Tax=Didymodactylos carnosus TaxID=1234261 RepID=A0A815TQ58_9BILA|nr:unnamed protein product [Didymodactylos carnosus]CAF4365267.1 unnamed protein product [Didymodactylos carnosus]
MTIDGTCSYVPQQPWIFSSSIRENILFGLPYEAVRFSEAVRASALDTDLEILPHGEWTLVGDNGVALSGGQKARVNLARALYRNSDIYLLDDPLAAVDTKVGKYIFQKCIRNTLKSKIVILVTHHVHFLQSATKILYVDHGKIVAEGKYHELIDKNEFFTNFVTEVQHQKSVETVSESNDKLKYRQLSSQLDSVADDEHDNTKVALLSSNYENLWIADTMKTHEIQEDEAKVIGGLNSKLFVKYFQAGTGYLGMIGLLCLFTLTIVLLLLSDWWLARWGKEQGIRKGLNEEISNCSSKVDQLISNMSTVEWNHRRNNNFYVYLTLNVGRIINRFSKDTENMDEQLPMKLFNLFDTQCTKQFENYLNQHTKPYWLLMTVDRWSGIRYDWMSAAFVTFLVVTSLIFHKSLQSAKITVALVYSLTLIGQFQWMIRLGVEVMLQMISVERISEYCHLPLEEEPNQKRHLEKPKPHWPHSGEISFQNLSFRYSEQSSWILDKINIQIKPSEKVGIVGRTGAGKSSIIQALFRTAELDGKILIDGIDTQTISLYDLRRRLSIIPQDPVLFDDTLRKNVDPFGEFSDVEIWNALEEVQLKLSVSSLPNGLQQQVTEGGSNFSVGERQLICLARALLRKNKILVIDEATANVDMRTDYLIQQALRKKFKNYTVLTIAHRLRTVIDNDRILVLSNGQVIDFDHPYILLSNSNSYFYEMVQQTQKSEIHHLMKQAKKYYKKKDVQQQEQQQLVFESTL